MGPHDFYCGVTFIFVAGRRGEDASCHAGRGSGGGLEDGGSLMSVSEKDNEIVFSDSELAVWREGVQKRREELFRRNWKNRRANPLLKSRQQEKSFQFVVEWYEEFDEVVARERERNRLDRLIAQGLDVNDPNNK